MKFVLGLSLVCFVVQVCAINYTDHPLLPKASPPRVERTRHLDQLVATKCQGELTVKSFCKAFGTSFVRSVPSLGLAIVTSVCSAKVIDYLASPSEKETLFNSGTFAKAQAYAAAATKAVEVIFNAVMECKMDSRKGFYEVHKILMEASREKMDSFSEGHRAVVSMLDRMIQDMLKNSEGQSLMPNALQKDYKDLGSEVKRNLIKLLRRREAVLMALPTESLNVAGFEHGGNGELDEVMNKRINQLIDTLEPKSRQALAVLAYHIRDNSVNNSTEETKRAQAYLYGPPGTGKTRFVELLAKALGLPICHLNMKNKNSKYLLGLPYFEVIAFKHADEEIFGNLFMCLVRTGVRNPIIFFDEASSLLNIGKTNNPFDKDGSFLADMLKLLLNPEQSTIHIMEDFVPLDLSRATFILAGNEPVADDALKSRLPQITFERLTDEQKSSILDKAIEDEIARIETKMKEPVVESIKTNLNLMKNLILELDIKSNPGGRITKMVVHELSDWIRYKLSRSEPIKEEELKKEVIACFERRTGQKLDVAEEKKSLPKGKQGKEKKQ